MILGAVINWNGWRDTITCVQSTFKLCGPPFQLVICDNGSSDGSFDHLFRWLEDDVGATSQSHCDPGSGMQVVRFEGPFGLTLQSIHLLRLSKNFGYAGAFNCCIAWARKALMAHDFWLLNNDVKVDPQALAELAAVAHSSEDIGLCGSVLREWNFPHAVQAIGGVYIRPLAVGRHLKTLPADVLHEDIFFGIDYPVGASLFVTAGYLETVGLMDDAYFLYYEEMDWVERGRRHGFRPAVALKSTVHHKEGASTGSHGGVRRKSILSERYGVVNRLRITRKFWPAFLPLVWMSLWLVILNRIVHGEWVRAQLILRLMFEPRQWLRDNGS